MDHIKEARAAGQSSVLILLDLLAAFDTVNHRVLVGSNIGFSLFQYRDPSRLGAGAPSLCYLVWPDHPLTFHSFLRR